jgi:MFS family permease
LVSKSKIAAVSKTLPFAVASPIAGLLIDRFDRRRLMIAADLIRAVLVLGFLFVDEPGEVWVIYVLGSLQMVVSALFIPARSASIPNITTERELLTANALSAATWSTLLAVGAALGGLVTQALGVRAVFVLDSLSYVVSAFFIVRATIPQATDRPPAGGAILRRAWLDIVAGWRHMWARPSIGRMALAKATWAVGGGGLVYMLALLGEKLHPAAPAVGMGVLYSARGLGTGIGPVVMRKFLPQESRWPAMMGMGIVASGVGYLFIGSITWSIVLAFVVVLAHAPSGANWVASSVLLQKRTEDRFRGRVFATEWLAISLVDSLSILGASLLLEWADVTLRTAILVFAGIEIACGVIWLLLVVPAERKEGLRGVGA